MLCWGHNSPGCVRCFAANFYYCLRLPIPRKAVLCSSCASHFCTLNHFSSLLVQNILILWLSLIYGQNKSSRRISLFYIHFHPSLLNRTVFATQNLHPLMIQNILLQRFSLFYSVFQFDIQAVCKVEQIKPNLQFVLYSFLHATTTSCLCAILSCVCALKPADEQSKLDPCRTN